MKTPQFLKRLLGLRDPRRAANLVVGGVVRARDGDLRAALAAYRQAVEADDTYALAHLNVALALQDLYNEERAALPPDAHGPRLDELAGHLELATRLDPDLEPAYRALGFVERARGRHGAARDAFQTYLSRAEPKDAHRERVEAALQEVAEQASITEAIQAAVAAAERVKDIPEADRLEREASLRAALAKAPGRAEGWWALGVLRDAARDPAGAVEALERALAADGSCIPAHKELSSLHFHANAPAKALPHARAAYDADPTNPALVCNVGVCHLALGNLHEASEYLVIAKGLAPKDPIVLDCLKALEEARAAAPR